MIVNMKTKELLDNDWKRLVRFSGTEIRSCRWYNYFSFRFAPVALIRFAYHLYSNGYIKLSKLTSGVNFLIFKIEVPSSLKIGPGLVIPHPQGTVLGAREIGANVTIFHQVTLGATEADFVFVPSKRPKVCDGVTLGVGSKILGSVTLGENCTIGANAVVLNDVPVDATVAGVPAKVVSIHRKNR